MKRYSNLYGTIYANANSNVAVYSSVGSSQQLPTFLNEIGAANAQLTVDTVRNILAGFPDSEDYKEHYAAQPKNDLPVSVRYAPMHLRNHPDMPSTIKPFTAIGISGSENKRDEGDNRYSTYVQTFYIGREHMHEAVTEKVGGITGTWNYLDQIFGTHLLGHEELALIRANRLRMDYDALPEKVHPVLRPQDRTAVFNAVDAVFDNKTVVIRLERGCCFNSRAWQLLIPIYALMPPRLATEIGFATYLKPAEVQTLADKTSIRIFVIPGECQWQGRDGENTLVMDLNQPQRATAPEEVGKVLNRWNRMPWEKRQVAMEKIFADTAASYNDKNLFLQRSVEFLDQADAWEKGGWVEKGAFTTLEELKRKYESLPLCQQIPWMRDGFIARVPAMMQEKGAIHRLTGQALARWRLGKEESAKELYEFGLSMGGTNARAMADAAASLKETQVREELAVEIATVNRRVEEARAEGAAAVERTRAEGAAAMAQAKHEWETALAAQRQETEAVRTQAAQTLQTEQSAHTATREKLAAEAQAHQATSRKLEETVRERDAMQQEIAARDQRLERAKTAYQTLKQEKAAADQRLAEVDETLAQAQQLSSEAHTLRAEADLAKRKAEKVVASGKKQAILCAAAGFVVAALIFGILFLILKPAATYDQENTLPTAGEIQETTEEPTESIETVPETRPTEEPTEAPTEPEPPDLTDWSTDAPARWLQEKVAGVTVEANPEEIPENLLALQDMTAVAVIRGENEENYAILLQKKASPEEAATDPTEGTAADPTEEGSVEPTGEPDAKPEALQVPGAAAVLTGEEFTLVLYGDGILPEALTVYGEIVPVDATVSTWWSAAPEASLDDMIFAIQGRKQWWRGLEQIITEEKTLTEAVEAIQVQDVPVAQFRFSEESVYLFRTEKEALAESLNERLLQNNMVTSLSGLYVAMTPKNAE